jgi:hypothetical protein
MRKVILNSGLGDHLLDQENCTGWLIKHLGTSAERPKKFSTERKWFVLHDGLLGYHKTVQTHNAKALRFIRMDEVVSVDLWWDTLMDRSKPTQYFSVIDSKYST